MRDSPWDAKLENLLSHAFWREGSPRAFQRLPALPSAHGIRQKIRSAALAFAHRRDRHEHAFVCWHVNVVMAGFMTAWRAIGRKSANNVTLGTLHRRPAKLSADPIHGPFFQQARGGWTLDGELGLTHCRSLALAHRHHIDQEMQALQNGKLMRRESIKGMLRDNLILQKKFAFGDT